MHQLVMERPHLNDLPARRAMGEGYAVRLAEGPDDERALAAVLTAAFGEPWSEDRVRQELTRSANVPAVFVVTWQGTTVATASCLVLPEDGPGIGWVHWVGADPAHAGKGLGTTLVLRVLEEFHARGATSARLRTDDFRVPAIRSYLRCGFLPELKVDGEDQRGRWSAVMEQVFASR